MLHRNERRREMQPQQQQFLKTVIASIQNYMTLYSQQGKEINIL